MRNNHYSVILFQDGAIAGVKPIYAEPQIGDVFIIKRQRFPVLKVFNQSPNGCSAELSIKALPQRKKEWPDPRAMSDYEF